MESEAGGQIEGAMRVEIVRSDGIHSLVGERRMHRWEMGGYGSKRRREGEEKKHGEETEREKMKKMQVSHLTIYNGRTNNKSLDKSFLVSHYEK
jgi:hypothetical protein